MKRILPLFLLAGCFSTGDDSMIGEAEARIAQVPGDVSCIKITVAGSRSVTHPFDVTPGQSSVLSLKGLPVGDVTVAGQAFSTTCSAIGMGTEPTWLSDPAPATLVAGVPVGLKVTLHKNGEANIDVDFEDGDGGGPPADLGGGSDGGTGPVDLASSGFLAASPTQVNFNAGLGSSESQLVFFKNVGGASIAGPLSAIKSGDWTRFTIQSDGCTSVSVLPVGSSCKLGIRYDRPLFSAGGTTASLIFNAPGQTLTVPLIGN
jgi:hypothetical protein